MSNTKFKKVKPRECNDHGEVKIDLISGTRSHLETNKNNGNLT
jgi:hypothetical protein